MSALRISGVGVWLVVLWLLLWNDLSVGNVIAGALVALVVLTGARLPKVNCVGSADGERARVAPLSLLYFLGYVLVKLVQSNLVLAWEIITPRTRSTPASLRCHCALSPSWRCSWWRMW